MITAGRQRKALSMIVFCALFIFIACLKPEITQRDLNRQIALARAQAQQEIDALKSELDRLKSAHSASLSERAEAERLQTEIDRLRNSYAEIEKEREDLSATVSKLQALAAEAERLSAEARAARDRAESVERERDDIRNELRRFIDVGGLGVDITPDGIMITMRESILFDSGKSDLKSSSEELLAKLGEILVKARAREIRITGHTDNVPIRTPQFPSNWELSTARALSVLHRLADKHGVPESKLVAVGFGSHKPIAENTTAEGRAKNRRVELYLVPEK